MKAKTPKKAPKPKKHRAHQTLLVTAEEALAERKWFLFDANGKTLGRFASEIANVLRGKHKVNFTPYVDAGDGVVIINAEKIKVTGAKSSRKVYRYYTGWMGGLRETPYDVMLARNPTHILRHAIKGMMPKTRLSEHQLKKLRIFAGDKHDHTAQNLISVNL